MDPRPYHYEYRRPRFSNPTFKSDHLYQSIYHLGSNGGVYSNINKISNNGYSVPIRNGGNRESIVQEQWAKKQRRNQQIKKIDPYILQQRKAERKSQAQYSSPNNYQNNYIQNSNKSIKQPQPQPKFAQQIENISGGKQKSQPKRYQNINDNYQSSNNNNTHNIDNYKNDVYNEQSRKYYQNKSMPQQRSYSQDANTNKRNSIQQPGYLSNYGSRLVASMVKRGDQDYIYERQQKPYNIINCYPKQVMNTHRNFPKYTLQHKLIQNGHYPIAYNPTYNPTYNPEY